MKKSEKEQIKKAIRLLMLGDDEGGDFTEGMNILCKMVALRYPAAEIKEISLSDIKKFLGAENQEFNVSKGRK